MDSNAERPFAFQVTDLKQFAYCPRILYYHTILPQVRPVTYKMVEGTLVHQENEGRSRRRSLKAYKLAEGERRFNVPLFSPEMRLSGELDMLIETPTEWVPVDFKNAKREGVHYRLQLLAYAELLKQVYADLAKPIKRGFLYLIPLRRAVEVKFTPALRRKLNGSLAAMTDIALHERMPMPTKQVRRCVDCEFRRFCNDVL